MTFYLLAISFFSLVHGTNALTDTDVTVVVAGIIAGILLISLVVAVPLFIYLWRKRKRPDSKRPTHFANGHPGKPTANGFHKPQHYAPRAPPPQQRPIPAYRTPIGTYRGVPIVNMAPQGSRHPSRQGTPRGSKTTTPRGSVRGHYPMPGMRGGSARMPRGRRPPPMVFPFGTVGPRGPFPMPGARRPQFPPGPYGYPDPMMYPYPYFFPPPFPVYVDDDDTDDDSESDDDRRSNRSTMREQKIREIDSDEEKKIKEEEKRKRERRTKSRSRSRTPERRSPFPSRRRTPSPERYRSTMHQDIYTEVQRTSKRESSIGSAGDTAAQIDELFSFSSDANARPGDVIFMPPGKHVDTSTRTREPSPPRRPPSPVRGRSPSPAREPSPVPLRESTPPIPGRKPIKHESDYHYASVIRSSEPEQPQSEVSMAERLQNIVETGHTTVEHDLERHNIEQIQYPPKENNLSKTMRPYTPERDVYATPAKNLSATSKPDLYPRYSSDFRRTSDDRRPRTPPIDFPNETPVPTPRQSLIRRPDTPPNDIPNSSRSPRPSTPPFDGDDVTRRTSTPAVERKSPVVPPINLGSTQQAKSAFSNLVLEELKERHRVPETQYDDTDDAHRAVNFSASPPEIIPRSEPNSPRTSQNLSPDYPTNDQVVPPAPPPPPPPPPVPK